MKSILSLDNRLSRDMGIAEKPGLLRTIAVFFAHSGDSWLWAVALLVVWLVGDPSWKRLALVLLGSICSLALAVFPLKQIIHRRRPDGLWGTIYRKTDPHSFPSGHAARAFMIALLLTALGPSWLAVAAWIWAPLVAVSRVAMGVHYLSDILGGFVLGILAALIIIPLVPPLVAFFSGLLPWLF